MADAEVCRWCWRDIEWDSAAEAWRHVESGSRFCPDGTPAARDITRRRRLPASRSAVVIETGPAAGVSIEVVGNAVHIEWYGPRHVEMAPDVARSMGYVLRSAAGRTGPEAGSPS